MQKKFVYIIFLITSVVSLMTPINLFGQTFNDFEEAGTYPVIIKDEYNQDSKVIYITVLFPRSEVDTTKREGIDAHDINIEKGVFNTLSDLDLIKLSKAHAWDLDNGNNIPIVSVSREIHEEENNWYKVTFFTTKGTNTTINVIETTSLQSASNNFIDNEFYINFFEFISIYEMIFLLLLFILVPIIILGVLYWLTNVRVKKVENLLYKQECK